MTTKPFHVLLLSGGNRSLHKGNKPIHNERDENGDFNDYLRRRKDFRTKASAASPHHRAEIVKSDDADDQADSATDNSGEGGLKRRISSLRNVASPLEIAMAACCDRCGVSSCHEAGDSGSNHRVKPEISTSLTSSSSSSSRQLEETNKLNAGVLRSGKEGHFLKLMLMYCPKDAVGHRALALAILQRTIDWEISNNVISHSKLKTDPATTTSKLGTDTGETAEDGAHVQKSPLVNAKEVKRNPHDINAERTTCFLVAGGMKLLARWLIDSFTVISVPSTNQRVQGKLVSTQRTASKTGCLLLPLLRLLKCIPFDKNIVVESQIHKSIKRLKKALDKLVEGRDPSSLEGAVHPIAGGLSVGKVIVSVDDIMASWGEAAAANVTPSSDSPRTKVDPHQHLQENIRLRFGDLARFQNEDGEPPAWLPKSILGMWRAASTTTSHLAKSKNPIHALKANSMPAVSARDFNGAVGKQPTSHLGKFAKPLNSQQSSSSVPASTRPRDSKYSIGKQVKLLRPLVAMGQQNRKTAGLFSGKRKGAVIMLPDAPKSAKMPKREAVVGDSSKKVSWADRPTIRDVPPRPLKEERHFVKEEMVAAEEEFNAAPEEERHFVKEEMVAQEEFVAAPKEEPHVVKEEMVAQEEFVAAPEGVKEEPTSYEDDSDMEDLF